MLQGLFTSVVDTICELDVCMSTLRPNCARSVTFSLCQVDFSDNRATPFRPVRPLIEQVFGSTSRSQINMFAWKITCENSAPEFFFHVLGITTNRNSRRSYVNSRDVLEFSQSRQPWYYPSTARKWPYVNFPLVLSHLPLLIHRLLCSGLLHLSLMRVARLLLLAQLLDLLLSR